jgi:prepilin-type N-terminal cleavage/methylation domain-containing protein
MKLKMAIQQGFSLVEILVATAVLSILALIIVQVISLTGRAINISSQNLDAAGQARLVFDRLAIDLAARPDRSDLGMIFTKKTTNASDCFRFYSQVGGYNGARGITAVGYRIQTTNSNRLYQLERGATGTDFLATAQTPIQFLPQTIGAADAVSTDNPDTDYEVLAKGVFRLEFCYLLASGKLTIANPNASPTDFTGISAIVVALGVIDNRSLELLSGGSGTQLAALSNALQKTSDGDDPVSEWNQALSSGLVVSGIPHAVLQNLRVYERIFYVR